MEESDKSSSNSIVENRQGPFNSPIENAPDEKTMAEIDAMRTFLEIYVDVMSNKKTVNVHRGRVFNGGDRSRPIDQEEENA